MALLFVETGDLSPNLLGYSENGAAFFLYNLSGEEVAAPSFETPAQGLLAPLWKPCPKAAALDPPPNAYSVLRGATRLTLPHGRYITLIA